MPATPDECRAYRESLKKRARQALSPFVCRRCGTDSDIEFAHKRPTRLSGEGRGAFHRYRDVIRHPDRYIPLCKECHYIYDHSFTSDERIALEAYRV